MKKVILAQSAGFCFGVSRAVETVNEQVSRGQKPIYTYGPIIHNEQVVAELEKKGVLVFQEQDLSRLAPNSRSGTMVLRSHGVSRAEYEQLERAGYACVDATCPFVKKIHRIVAEESKKGSFIVIIGNADHPEVKGIQGWIQSDFAVIETPEEAQKFHLDPPQPVCVVSQTTFNNNKFKDLVEILKKKGYNMKCVKTICNATEVRQHEARKIAGQVEAMIVIGGKNSSNTQKLFEICSRECENTFYIQTISDLDMQRMQVYNSIGITAGASTPKNIIEEVQKNVRNEF